MGLTFFETLYDVLLGDQLTITTIVMNLLVGVILTCFLVWFVSKLNFKPVHLMFLVWVNLFIVRYFNNMVEGYFFTTVFPTFNSFLTSIFPALILTLIEGILVGLLITPKATQGHLYIQLVEYFSTRGLTSWILRIGLASIVYFPIYFFFGMLISPFVIDNYNDPALGLKIPPFTVIIPLEFFRGFLYVLVFIPLIAGMVENRKTEFFILAAMLFVPGAFIPLVMGPSLPASIIPFHLVEILADSIVYGYALSRILGKLQHPSGG